MSLSDGKSPPRGKESTDPDETSGLEHNSPDASEVAGSSPRKASFDRIEDPANEQSPLLQASQSEDEEDGLLDDDTALDHPDEYQVTKSVWYLIILTISLAGLQIAWSVELSNGSPYLLSLGLSKSLMALVWIAGPLSGTLVQPYVGVRSDNCRIPWGKRKPFILGGAAATIVSLLALAWTKEVVGGLLGIFGAQKNDPGVKVTTIVVAVLFVYILDFAINTSMILSLILPSVANTVQSKPRLELSWSIVLPHTNKVWLQHVLLVMVTNPVTEAANAMGSRMTGIGNIIGYCFGYINLPRYMWFFGDTQFKILCIIASLCLAATVAISIFLIKERDPREEGPPRHDKGGVVAFFKGVFSSIKRLPPQTRKVCEVQFFAWIGWFGFLFYLSTWVAELYVEPIVEANPGLTPEDIDRLYEKGTRIGTFALLVWASVSLASNVFLPFFIAPTYDAPFIPSATQMVPSIHSHSSSASYSTRLDRFLERLVIPWLSLRRAWTISLVMFGLCMFSTLIVPNPTIATIVVGIVGIPWSLTIWAPFAIISAEISKRDALRRAQALNLTSSAPVDPLSLDDNGDQAGVILGIHNVSIAAPQVIATLGSSLIFKFLQKPRGTPGDISMPASLAAGGLFALIAAYMASRLAEDGPVEGLEAARSLAAHSGARRETAASQHRRSLSRSRSFETGLTY
jgi:solute carrier family 45, member 1/2/4